LQRKKKGMTKNLYSLVYSSRNKIQGDQSVVNAELRRILTSSRARNKAAGVTGALLYNSGNFAQVLEGPLDAVESTFERIQRDPRHSEAVVLRMSAIPTRQFPVWSMAFAGYEASREPLVAEALMAALDDPASAGIRLLGILRDLVAQESACDNSSPLLYGPAFRDVPPAMNGGSATL
jgi:hypothetical protein